MIKFSICIPAFKDKFLKECISSILDQSNIDFELIILNDCSPYPIRQIVEQFRDSRIRYCENEQNVGGENLIQNWNKLLSLAQGEFIVIMGDDDRMDKSYLEEFSRMIVNFPKANVFHCRSKIIDENSNVIMLTPSWPEFESVYNNIWHRITERRSQFISDFVYRTSVLRTNNGFYPLPLAWGSDDITAYIACGTEGIVHTEKTVFQYRTNGLSITSTGNYEQKMKSNLLYESWLRKFLTVVPNSEEDLIIRNDLIKNLNRYMKKRKIYVMTKSMKTDIISNALLWINKRKEYNITVIEVFYSFVESIKKKYSSNNF